MTHALLTYNEHAILARMKRMIRPQVALVATASVERMSTSYHSFCQRTGRGDWITFRAVLDAAWTSVGLARLDADLKLEMQRILNVSPTEESWEGEWPVIATIAAKAGNAMYYVLRFHLTGDVQEAAWAMRMMHEALFIVVQETVGPSPTANGPASVKWAESHPVMQQELARQERDFQDIEAVSSDSIDRVAERLRERASRDSPTTIPPLA